MIIFLYVLDNPMLYNYTVQIDISNVQIDISNVQIDISNVQMHFRKMLP